MGVWSKIIWRKRSRITDQAIVIREQDILILELEDKIKELEKTIRELKNGKHDKKDS